MDKQAISELAAGAVSALSANLNTGGAMETPLSRWISSRLSATIIAALRKSPTDPALLQDAEQELVALLTAQPALIQQLAGLMRMSHNGIVMPQDGKI
ncbi:hypothetical protein [Chitinophaga sp.]|uniref:hypothetical protein n=1 Tax=Chitinophaga sp. TaxID=1869181 RepID=UPI0031DEA196